MLSVCLRYIKDRDSAQEVVQDGFIKVFDKLEVFDFKGSFEGWMKRVTVNTVLQKYRKQRVFNLSNEEQLEEAEIEIEDNAVPLDFLLKIVQELPDRYRLVFTMYVLDDYAHKEISEIVGISVGTSKSNLARARGILKVKVEDYYKVNKLK